MPAPDRLIRAVEVSHLAGLSRSSIYALMQQNDQSRFPRPIKIGWRSRWSQNAVLAWIEQQKKSAMN